MAMRQDFSASRKKGLTTYGKAARKRQPKTVFTPTAFPPILEDDTVSKPKATLTRRRPSLLSSPLRDPTSPISRNVEGTTKDTEANTSEVQDNVQNSDRKRKISQVYASKGRVQEPARSNQGGRIPNRSRPSSSTSVQQTIVAASRPVIDSASAGSMDFNMTGSRMSSPPPPPTPTLPKASKQPKAAVVKGAAPSASGTKGVGKSKQDKLQQQIPLRFARESTTKTRVPSAPSLLVNEEDIPSRPQSVPDSVAKKRRKRLIDALVEQTNDDDEINDPVEEVFESQSSTTQPSLSHGPSDISMLDSQVLPQTPERKAGAAQVTGTRTFARSSSALKFTYGQGRKVLDEEEDLLEALALPEMSVSLKGRRLELGTPKKQTSAQGAFDNDDSGLNNSPNSKLRDIHELRQAGANSRVADTMQDLVDQIGSPTNKPSSSRRAALLQVAEKIKDKTFMWQCRDHGVEAALLKDVGEESDVISGYLILSILVTIFTKWPSSHIQQLVRLGKPASMFARLLGISRDIKVIARDRKSNLSKRSQTSLLAIQTMLGELSIWGESSLSHISSRTLVLKCLHLLVTQNTNAAKDLAIFSPAVTEALFSVLSEASENPDYWDYPKTVEAIDFAHALSLLDYHAISIAESQRASADWAARYLPIVADIFGASSRYAMLDNPAQEGDGKLVEDAVLKLTINLTNNNTEAPEIFVSKGLIPALAGSISSNFSRIWASLSQDTWVDGILDSLVLRLGILINFAEHSPLVRQVINDCSHDDQRPVDELIRLFLENYRRTAEADSMETSHLNVAFGYLTVLLGYLALHPPVRQKIRKSHSTKSIGPLLDSLREFLTHHKKVEQNVNEDEDGTEGRSSSDRLQDLVHQLEDQAAYD
ncbi:hypothetical protein M426DRAFT_10232 [Hypoxylon sp. CI-4A]|nr:hypothetical protein M426DRAFT_10232 [Hypoxylon sp. CI-4A]